MNKQEIAQIVMSNMPQHSGSRSRVEESVSGVEIIYNREYGNRWGWTGWSADQVTVDGQQIEVDPTWVNYRK